MKQQTLYTWPEICYKLYIMPNSILDLSRASGIFKSNPHIKFQGPALDLHHIWTVTILVYN